MRPIRAWWFAAKRTLPHGDDRQIRVGRTHLHKGRLAVCQSGLHASRRAIDALQYAPGTILYRVECSGEIAEESDKLACTRRKYLAGCDVADMLRHFARLCALDVIHHWDAPDVVMQYLRTGDDALRSDAHRAAWDAAWSPARSAAQSAARSAAWSAASSAAWDAAWSAAESAAWSGAQSGAQSAAESAARSGAWDAAWSAAWDAAWSPAWDAAWSAAWDAQNRRLHRMALQALARHR